jgi:hypothetical protein
MNIWAQIDSGFGQWTIGVYKFVVHDLWFTDLNPRYKYVQRNWGYLFFSCLYYHAWSFVHSLFHHRCNWLRVFWSLVLRDSCRAATSTATMRPSTPRLIMSLGGCRLAITMSTLLKAFTGAPSTTGGSAPPTSTAWWTCWNYALEAIIKMLLL